MNNLKQKQWPEFKNFIDAARRVFYVHDYKLIVCYKMPEDIVY
jgi:hypothetical protein